ncbi:MAG TPA: hypothetical protein VI855_09395 [Dehalococcoidia bacterium]|nr:hypothetical protein [Dehalococcoidia bacterium]
MSIQDYLSPTETLLGVCPPFYATSRRVIRLEPRRGPEGAWLLEIPYQQLRSVRLVHQSHHPMLAVGTLMVLLGLYLTTLSLLTSVFPILAGAAFLVFGARGRPRYYQLHAPDLPPEAERWWRVEYAKSASFIATLRHAIGQGVGGYGPAD